MGVRCGFYGLDFLLVPSSRNPLPTSVSAMPFSPQPQLYLHCYHLQVRNSESKNHKQRQATQQQRPRVWYTIYQHHITLSLFLSRLRLEKVLLSWCLLFASILLFGMMLGREKWNESHFACLHSTQGFDVKGICYFKKHILACFKIELNILIFHFDRRRDLKFGPTQHGPARHITEKEFPAIFFLEFDGVSKIIFLIVFTILGPGFMASTCPVIT